MSLASLVMVCPHRGGAFFCLEIFAGLTQGPALVIVQQAVARIGYQQLLVALSGYVCLPQIPLVVLAVDADAFFCSDSNLPRCWWNLDRH